MGQGAKKLRFRADPRAGRRAGTDERRRAADRRDPSRAGEYTGVERRSGPRRSADLARPAWHRALALGVAVLLGIAAGLALGSLRSSEPASASAPAPADGSAPTSASAEALLAEAEALRDEAEALTPAGVALDERAHERWMPRVAGIELALADPATPAAIRAELDATLAALERVGVLQP